MKVPALLAACATFASCAAPLPEASPAPAPLANTSPFTITVSGRVRAADRATLTEIVNATVSVITSERFAAHLDSIQQRQLWLSPGGDTMSPREVRDIYLGRNDSMRPVPTVVTVTRRLFSDAPSTGWSSYSPARSTITLSTWEMKRWRQGSPDWRSCAVNTLAHEITHTISASAGRAEYVFTDQGRAASTEAGEPLVSYTVGSVAQCTMLESLGELSGTFAACLEKWGTNHFYSGTCS